MGAEIARTALERLRYDAKTVNLAERVIQHHMVPMGITNPKAVRKWRAKVGPDIEDDVLTHRAADFLAKDDPGTGPFDIERFITLVKKERESPIKAVTARADLAINGNDLKAVGIQPGPQMGQVLAALEKIVIEDPSLNTKEWLLARVEQGNLLEDVAQEEAPWVARGPLMEGTIFREDLHLRDDRGRFTSAVRGLFQKDRGSLRSRGLTVLNMGSGRIDVLDRGSTETFYNAQPQQVLQHIEKAVAERGPAVLDTGGKDFLNPARLAEAYDGFTHGGLRVRVNYAVRVGGQNAVEMDADVLNEAGEPVGHFVRNIGELEDGSPYAYHNEFRLDAAYQGKGFGSALSAHAEDAYRRAGVREIHLETDEVGGYAWARAGYEINGGAGQGVNETGVPTSTLEGLRKLEGRAKYAKRLLTEEEQEAFLALLPEYILTNPSPPPYTYRYEIPPGGFTSIADVAAFGVEDAVDGTWTGKRFLIGASWRGVKKL